MKMTEEERQRREKIVYLHQKERKYYDLAMTKQHQEAYQQYLSGQLNEQQYQEKLNKLIPIQP